MAGIRITSPVKRLYDEAIRAIPGAVGSGIAAQKPGFHNSRNNNSSTDYSVRDALNKQGPGDAAAAIDITMSATQMKKVTRVIMDAMKAKDPRVQSIYEVIGTVDNKNVVRYWRSTRTMTPNWGSSDGSHLWHIHISLFRADLEDWNKLKGIVELLSGKAISGASEEGVFDLLDLKKGDTGRQVVLLQTMLHSAGFSPGAIDGDYGPKTSASVLAMRKSVGSSVSNGDSMSPWAVTQLQIALARKHVKADVTVDPSQNVLPEYGDEGTHVQYWQRLLVDVGESVELTAKYDAQTKAAVSNYFHKVSNGGSYSGDRITSWIAKDLQNRTVGKGPKGDKGDQGDPGRDADISGNITVSLETGEVN